LTGLFTGLGLAACADDPPVMECQLIPTRVVQLGELADANSASGSLGTTVRRLSDGRYVMFHQWDVQLLLYDSVGRFLGHIGRPGGGPGELRMPLSLAVDGSDSIWVSEWNGRVTIFGPTGTYGRISGGVWPRYPQIQGFTPLGKPVVMRTPRDGGSVEVRDRIGSVTTTIDRESPDTAGATIDIVGTQRVAMLDDTTAAVRTALGDRVELWTPGSTDTLLRASDVTRAYGAVRGRRPIEPDSVVLNVIAVGEDGALWGTAFIKVKPLSELPTPPGRESPPLSLANRNITLDGFLWRFGLSDGLLRTTDVLDDLPDGFVSGSSFFSFREEPSGLVVADIWRVSTSCQ
jgi:hypothetical protein